MHSGTFSAGSGIYIRRWDSPPWQPPWPQSWPRVSWPDSGGPPPSWLPSEPEPWPPPQSWQP